MNVRPHLVVVGAGAAGCFAAIEAARCAPHAQVTLLEASPKPLAKVRISGGGRCNVMHHCFDLPTLTAAYPRGGKALYSVFSRFGPTETRQWFEQHAVALKTEPDGRMFPVTDDSATVVNALLLALSGAGVSLRCRQPVESLARTASGQWQVQIARQTAPLLADAVILACGGTGRVRQWLQALGQPWVEQVPSLFTFNCRDPRLAELAGISVPHVTAKLTLPAPLLKKPLVQQGPLLITHWGVSGPAILRLSAWGARGLAQANYQGRLTLDLAPTLPEDALLAQWLAHKEQSPRQRVATYSQVEGLPRRLWSRLVEAAGIGPEDLWAQVSKSQLRQLIEQVKRLTLATDGKSTNKDEFVTAGGVALAGVDFKTMESRHQPGLYFAGEVLDIDGITGGYNFQAAWSTGHLAGTSAVQFQT